MSLYPWEQILEEMTLFGDMKLLMALLHCFKCINYLEGNKVL